jgi:hypothetical protein
VALFWIAHREGDEPHVMVAEGNALLFARLRALIAGLKGQYVEGHQLTPAMARKVPKRMVGRPLSKAEAAQLITRLDRG